MTLNDRKLMNALRYHVQSQDQTRQVRGVVVGINGPGAIPFSTVAVRLIPINTSGNSDATGIVYPTDPRDSGPNAVNLVAGGDGFGFTPQPPGFAGVSGLFGQMSAYCTLSWGGSVSFPPPTDGAVIGPIGNWWAEGCFLGAGTLDGWFVLPAMNVANAYLCGRTENAWNIAEATSGSRMAYTFHGVSGTGQFAISAVQWLYFALSWDGSTIRAYLTNGGPGSTAGLDWSAAAGAFTYASARLYLCGGFAKGFQMQELRFRPSVVYNTTTITAPTGIPSGAGLGQGSFLYHLNALDTVTMRYTAGYTPAMGDNVTVFVKKPQTTRGSGSPPTYFCQGTLTP